MKMTDEELLQLEPHCPEWFSAYAAINPFQCAIIHKVVEKFGADGCAVCGDTPAADGVLSPGPPLRMRLCNDCQEIRKGMYDETFTIDEAAKKVG